MRIFDQIDHKCTISRERIPPRERGESLKYRLKRLWFSLVQVSPVHPLTIQFFATETQIREERRRHYESAHFFTIHPLSKLAVAREAYLTLFYMLVLFFRLLEFAFLRRTNMHQAHYVPYLRIVTFLDVLTWLNLTCMCFEGVIVKETKSIVIDLNQILRYRVRSFLFWCEFVSSVPKFVICPNKSACVRSFWLFLTCLRLLAVCLFYQPIRLLKTTLALFRLESRTVRLYVSVIYMMMFVTHLMACSGFAMARYRYILVGDKDNRSWIIRNGLIDRKLRVQYFYSFYIATAQTFGVHIDEFDEHVNWEESLVSVINYIIGKIMFVTMWVVNLNVLLAQDFYNAKYQEVISQLKTWMDNKELPKNLQKRLINYYNFYYQRYAFSKHEIESTMPHEVFIKVRTNMYKALRRGKGAVMSQVSDRELQKIGEHTATEFYSPNDVIIHSGMRSNAIYLIATGSIAVYSRSGTEVYHLYEGSYFGELSLMLPDQNVSGSVIAIEPSKVYRIERKYFERYIISKKDIYDAFLGDALDRFAKIRKVEDENRKSMMKERMSRSQN